MSKKTNYKYIGYHNQKEIVSTFGPDKNYAKRKCEELLLGYFHNLQHNITKYPLDYYNGVVAFVGETNVDSNFHPTVEFKYSSALK